MNIKSLSFFKEEMEKLSLSIHPSNVISLSKKLIPKNRIAKLTVGGGVVAVGSAPVFPKYEDEKANKLLQNRFNKIKEMVNKQGVYSGTKHKRIVIPKTKLTKKQIGQLGFKKSYVAIPESGQDQWVSYRHPSNKIHIHSHNNEWTIHKDRHASSQMMAVKRRSLFGKALAYPQGAAHSISEGIPGLITYAKSKISDRNKSLAKNVFYEQPKKIIKRTKRWVDLNT